MLAGSVAQRRHGRRALAQLGKPKTCLQEGRAAPGSAVTVVLGPLRAVVPLRRVLASGQGPKAPSNQAEYLEKGAPTAAPALA
eukprot:993200-Alexandrium_andersonii.AAC.1